MGRELDIGVGFGISLKDRLGDIIWLEETIKFANHVANSYLDVNVSD